MLCLITQHQRLITLLLQVIKLQQQQQNPPPPQQPQPQNHQHHHISLNGNQNQRMKPQLQPIFNHNNKSTFFNPSQSRQLQIMTVYTKIIRSIIVLSIIKLITLNLMSRKSLRVKDNKMLLFIINNVHLLHRITTLRLKHAKIVKKINNMCLLKRSVYP